MDLFGSTAGIIVFVVVLLLAIAITLFLVFSITFRVLRNVARQKEAGARERYPHARQIDPTASFFGQESRGATQMRGNGTLILTDSDLIFELWVPDKTFRVPLNSIQSIENPRSFLGKSRFAPLLKVNYRTEQGSPDSIAWQVSDLSGWMRLIDAARA